MPLDYDQTLFGDEHEIFRRSVRHFFETQAEPFCEEWDAAHSIPRAFWRKAGEAGILGIGVPESLGGPGGDFMHRIVIAQEMGYSIAGASIGPAFQRDQMCEQLMDFGSDEQKQRYLPRMVKGECLMAFTVTEPDSGSDLSQIRTTALRDGDHWVINGAKTYISGIADADTFMVACKTDPEAGARGISVIFVDRDTPGLNIGRTLKKMGCHASNNGELFFDNVRVPAKNLFGPENGGFKVLALSLNRDRLMWSIISHAAATRAFDLTLAFVKNRKGFGQTIFDFQNTQFKLAEMYAELMVGQAFIDRALQTYLRKGEVDMMEATVAKLWLPEMEGRVIDQCVQLHGGAGYMDEYPISRLYTAARLHRIFAGTTEIMRLQIGRSLR
ncbi:acyl-CoA dehydrogenase family protein [Croceicoccus sp. YJ47]|uniref:acyl-CoA dehydrogenase family protein n=1 Tax=Croceicoccus sp. YJ47 TaxID=2798724 RepID=UPI00192044BB|nr:acyl-CoA dehydrogenase family protein [Croceicoccus sp. YJ47]QQN75289.1 acyl-CoA dehydrogenase family protein [Croceicoccus sp. YJ47]